MTDIEAWEALTARYPLTELRIPIAGREWQITAVQDQEALIAGVQTDADLAAFPYGLMLWPSAVGLAERLAEEPGLVAGNRVLELGTGVGLPGLVAWTLGATAVVQTDYQEDALTLAAHNAIANGITGTRFRIGDWRAFLPEGEEAAMDAPADVVIASDVLYERTLHGALATLLPRLVGSGGRVVLSDPLRPQALEFIERYIEPGDTWRVTYEGRSVRVAWEREKTRKDIGIFQLWKNS